jgi:hypothetical protein
MPLARRGGDCIFLSARQIFSIATAGKLQDIVCQRRGALRAFSGGACANPPAACPRGADRQLRTAGNTVRSASTLLPKIGYDCLRTPPLTPVALQKQLESARNDSTYIQQLRKR